MSEQKQPPRFRVVLELTFPDADPSSTAEYHLWLQRMVQALEQSPACRCSDIMFREALTIPPDGSDYEDWRHLRGEFSRREDQAASNGNNGEADGSANTGPIDSVEPAELQRVWSLTQDNTSPEAKGALAEIINNAGTDPLAHALLARCLVLNLLQQKGVLSKWREQGKPDDIVYQTIAAVPIDEWSREHLESVVSQLENEQ